MPGIVWCPTDPASDSVGKLLNDTMHRLPGGVSGMVYGSSSKVHSGRGRLSQLGDNDVLYILAHGTNFNKVSYGTKNYSPSEVARKIERARLPKSHIKIELLICQAGAAFGTTPLNKRRKQLTDKLIDAQEWWKKKDFHPAQKNIYDYIDAGGTKAPKKYVDAYNAVKQLKGDKEWSKIQYNSDLGTNKPFALALLKALYDKGYRNLQIRSYTKLVSNGIDPERGVIVKDGPKIDSIQHTGKDYAITWSSNLIKNGWLS